MHVVDSLLQYSFFFFFVVAPSQPENVVVISKSSRAVNISWTPGFSGNSDIRNYTVEISRDIVTFAEARCEGLSSSGCVIPNSSTSASLVDLHPGRTYYIRVFATNRVGFSTPSLLITTTTDEEVPNAPPANITGNNITSTSIFVQWHEVPADNQNGIIVNYTITYTEVPSGNSRKEIVIAPSTNVTLTGLKIFTNYSITVFASTAKGDGNRSEPIIVITDEDRPSGFPLNLRPVDTSFSSILVAWNEVLSAAQNGIILTYTVRFQAIESAGVNSSTSINTTTVDSRLLQANLTNLKNDTKYNISILASTIKGNGPYSDPIFVTSNQKKPSAAPQNVQGHPTSPTEILVKWDEVPEDKQNGEILQYTILYRKTEGGEQKISQVNSRSVKLTGLAKYTVYSISVVAATIKGDGPASSTITVRTDEDTPSAAPLLSNVTALNSTSVLVEWERVPREYRNGIITKYTIYYRDELKKAEGTMVVKPPNKTAIVNGLRQQAEYSFWIVAATSKGNGPLSNAIKATTDAVPTILPPADDAIGAKQVSVKFVNRHALSNGSPVTYFRMIVITLPKGAEPGNPADEKYQNVTRVYDDQVDGEPYITAEFEREESRTTFTVGDGKYYSRSGITDAKRKRRAVPSDIKYLNGKLKENTEYAVFQRSFDQDENYENEGLIQFTTKKENDPESPSKSLTATIVAVVIVLVILLIVVVAIIVWRRRSPRNDIACCSRRTKNSLRQEKIEMSGNSHPSTSGSYYNSIQLLDEQHYGNRLTTRGQDTYDDVHLDESTYYNDVNPKQESTYQEIKNETCYQPLDLNRQVDYESLGQIQWQADDHYQPLNTTEKHIYGAPSASPPKKRK
ncbi:receptor-type tyrosine-protein phosphatase delta-like [Porites lutea]|uniref:receptor-type tyrosine-protein phosphatase delta-like n=1 Tax=Porites lutea TaxID=51062 RepID=UPI003CC56549